MLAVQLGLIKFRACCHRVCGCSSLFRVFLSLSKFVVFWVGWEGYQLVATLEKTLKWVCRCLSIVTLCCQYFRAFAAYFSNSITC